jgi:hypothetical protein
MTGWDATRRVNLDPPWESFWLDLCEDPPIQDRLNLDTAARAAIEDPRPEQAGQACLAIRPLVARHNLTNRAGEPIEIELEFLSVGLFLAITLRMARELRASADDRRNPRPALQRS